MRYGKGEKREAVSSEGWLYTIYLNPANDRYDVYRSRGRERVVLATQVYYFNRKQSSHGPSACMIASADAGEVPRFGPVCQGP